MRGDKQIGKGKHWEIIRTDYGEVVIESDDQVSLSRGIVRVPIPDKAVEALVADVAARENQVTELLEAGDE